MVCQLLLTDETIMGVPVFVLVSTFSVDVFIALWYQHASTSVQRHVRAIDDMSVIFSPLNNGRKVNSDFISSYVGKCNHNEHEQHHSITAFICLNTKINI